MLTQCQKLNLNVSNVFVEECFVRIDAAVENRTSGVRTIPAYQVNNNAGDYYRVESAQQGWELYSNSINGISHKVITISPEERMPFSLLFVVKKANKGEYSCQLVPVDKEDIDCDFFEVRIDREIKERQSNLISKGGVFNNVGDAPPHRPAGTAGHYVVKAENKYPLSAARRGRAVRGVDLCA